MSKRTEAEQAEVLAALEEHGAMRPGEVADKVQRGRSSTAATLRTLVSLGKAQTTQSPRGTLYEAL